LSTVDFSTMAASFLERPPPHTQTIARPGWVNLTQSRGGG